ncbi:MAG: Cysteine desulfurase [uncultured Rubrobacteraceae bacterium]|uniref:Cysteine desulfurase n=1 Tax=uncultured Rubrobacteraceae bacterium TaxID=349277 RepID=A0A6J4NPW0_9ACTN|nr:MAG: Cysteine desulfurase [uncultured Rubrobacteraceae bacterium]
MQQTFDVEAVRARFPALSRLHDGRPVAYFDGPGGSQVARPSIDAMTRYMERGGANLHGVFPTSTETEEILASTRAACAAFLGAEPDEVAFGANMTTLTLSISRALSDSWDEDSEIVVTELDHRANVDPWLIAAREKGAKVRWIGVDPETLTLNLSDLDQKINPRTKLVAVGLASNAVGTVNDVAAVAERAHAVGAVVAVDAVHAAPHVPMDREAIGADVLTCSAYKFFGPHVGVTAIRRGLFEVLPVYRLDPAPDHIPDKLETGTQNHEGIAGVMGAIEFIASLGGGASLRERLLDAMRTVEEHETRLADRFRAALREVPGVTLYAAPDTIRKTPTVAFRLEGLAPLEVCQHAADHGFFIAAGDFYASTLSRKLGLDGSGGFVRAGLAPYNTGEEVEEFVRVLRGLSLSR